MDLVTEQKLERRRRMLEAARQLIAERGYENITMRDLAEASRVSVPTLYNTFGGKDELIGEAVRASFMEMLQGTSAEVTEKGWQRLVAVVEQCAAATVGLPGYHRSLIGYLAGTMIDHGLPESLVRMLAKEIEAVLQEMKESRQLADWVDTVVVAEHISGLCIMASVEWAMGFYDDEGIAASMMYGTAMLLLGVARGSAKQGFEEKIKTSQAKAKAVIQVDLPGGGGGDGDGTGGRS